MSRALMEMPTARMSGERRSNLDVAHDSSAINSQCQGALDRRIEDWLVCYLDETDPMQPVASFAEMLETGEFRKSPAWTPGRTIPRKGRERLALTHDWARIDVRRKGSIVVVRFLDHMLIKENVIVELADELQDLIRAGNRRLVLNFSNVERMSSTIVAVLVKAHRVCTESPGGMLKVCGLAPSVADVFKVACLPGIVPILADEAAALADPWPASPPRALPLSILSAISDAWLSPTSSNSPDEPEPPICPSIEPENLSGDAEEPGESTVWLVVENGGAGGPKKGDVIAVLNGLFLIGRGAECHLRLRNDTFHPLHALIERRGDGVYFREMSNEDAGALINNRAPSQNRTRLKNGDRLRLGPLRLSVVIGGDLGGHRGIDELVASWLADWNDDQAEPVEGTSSAEIYAVDESASAEPESKIVRGPLWLEVIQDVLVVSPRIGRLDDENAVEQFRDALAELFDLPLPRRVVLKLDHVRHISSRAVGVLLAYFLRLVRAGGALRVCDLHARVFSLLEQLRLPVLLELCSTVDEAVITSWD